jgi:hypothetical protein
MGVTELAIYHTDSELGLGQKQTFAPQKAMSPLPPKADMDRDKSVRVRARLSVRRIVVPKRRLEIRPVHAHNRNGPQGWTPYGPLLPQQIAMVNDLPSFVNTPYRISSVGRWCNTKVPSDAETRPHNARNTSVARLISVIQFTFDPLCVPKT